MTKGEDGEDGREGDAVVQEGLPWGGGGANGEGWKGKRSKEIRADSERTKRKHAAKDASERYAAHDETFLR